MTAESEKDGPHDLMDEDEAEFLVLSCLAWLKICYHQLMFRLGVFETPAAEHYSTLAEGRRD